MTTSSLAASTRTESRVAPYLLAATIDGSLIGLFMVSASLFGILLFHPESPIAPWLEPSAPIARRMLMGLAMGATAVALIYSPLGTRSGALMNPAMTLTFLRLGRLTLRQACTYFVAQFAGAAAGMAVSTLLAQSHLDHPSVRYVVTQPGMGGMLLAWLGEFVITFVLVNVVLSVNRIPRLAPYTGCFAGMLVALYITIEAPLSGMSMNPARTFASSLFADLWSGEWIYFTAPPLGMLAAAELQMWITRAPGRLCGKLSHPRHDRCIFKCNCRRESAGEGQS